MISGLMGIPRGDETVYQDVGSTFSCKFRGGYSENIRPPAETVREEKDVIISSGRDRQWSKVVNADGYPGFIRQWYEECRPADSLARYFSRLTLEAASYPPFCAEFHTDPPVEAFHYFKCACDTKVARGIGVACVHDPRSGQVRQVDANGVIKDARLRRLLWVSDVKALVMGFRTSSMESSSPCNRWTFAARSAVSAISGLVCQGKWSQREGGRE